MSPRPVKFIAGEWHNISAPKWVESNDNPSLLLFCLLVFWALRGLNVVSPFINELFFLCFLPDVFFLGFYTSL